MDERYPAPIEKADVRIIEDDLMIPSASFEIDMSGIQQDIEELTAAIDNALTVYGDYLVEPDGIKAMDFQDTRRCERALSSAIREADEKRRQLNRDYKLPLDVAKRRYDELMGPVVEFHALFKAHRIALEEEERDAKKRSIQDRYEQMAGFIALPLEGQDEPLVPFERIFERFGGKWLNKGTSLGTVELELSDIVARIALDEQRLDAAGLVHTAEAKSVYWQTLDYDAALAYDQQLILAERRQSALEAARAEQAPPSLEQAPLPAEEKPDVQARTPRVMIIDGATDDECHQIGAFCKSLGISGTFKGPRFHEAVRSLL